MAKFRMVHTEFWTDPNVIEEMTPEDKYFFLYILTNPNTTQVGIYEITKKQIAFDMGYSLESINSLFDRFIKHHEIIKYNDKTRELAIKNWGKFNLTRGGKPMMDCIRAELAEVKDISLIEYVAQNIVREDIKAIFQSFYDTSTIRGQEEEEEEDKEEDKEEEEEEDKEEEEDSTQAVPYKKIKDMFHSICKSYSKIRVMSAKRKEHVRARWKQYDYDIEAFKELFILAERSNFLKGKNNRGWKADFDWLINENNMAKVLEGKYENQRGNANGIKQSPNGEGPEKIIFDKSKFLATGGRGQAEDCGDLI